MSAPRTARVLREEPLVRELARTLTTLEHDLATTVRERGRRLRSMGGGRS